MNINQLSNYLEKIEHYLDHQYSIPNDKDYKALFSLFQRSTSKKVQASLETKFSISFLQENLKMFLDPHIVLAIGLSVILKDGRQKTAQMDLLPIFQNHSIFKEKKAGNSVIKELQIRCKIGQVPMSQASFYEILAKKVSVLGLSLGATIVHRDLDGRVHKYFVKKIIQHAGLKAFVVQALGHNHSFVMFRPTTKIHADGGLLTLADDFHEKIGKIGYDLAFHDFEKVFKYRKKPMHVIGFSLAGAYAARLLADFPHKISEGYFYNDPSTESSVNKRFLDSVRLNPKHAITLNIHHHAHDVITWFGQEHLGLKRGYDHSETGHLHVNFTKYTQARSCTLTGTIKEKIMKLIPFLKETYVIHTDLVMAPKQICDFFHQSSAAEPFVGHHNDLCHDSRYHGLKWYEEFRLKRGFIRKIASKLVWTLHELIGFFIELKKTLFIFYKNQTDRFLKPF